jgi:dolichyl-phosphate-mannose-protein mannosyltransferase
MGGRTKRRALPWTAVALAALIAVGLLLRLPSFSDGLWGDELATNYVVYGFGVDDFGSILIHGKEATPPAFFLLTWLTKGFDGTEGLRLVSLLAGLAAIPLTFLVGTETVGRRAAAVGATLVALSPFQIWYSTEARAYELLMLACLLAAFTLLRAVRTGRASWWVGYGLSAAFAMYTHYAAVFILVGLFGWALLAHPESRRPLLLASLGAALLFAPWIPQFIDDTGKQAAQNIEMFHPLTLGHAKTDLLRMSFGAPLLDIQDLPGDVALALIAGSVALGVLGLAARGRGKRRWWRPSSGLVLVVVLALAPPVGAALHNLVAPSIFTPRNLIAAWPGFALLMGALVTVGPQAIRVASVSLLVAGFGIGAVKMLDDENRRPDLVSAAEYIERTGGPGAPVVDLPQLGPGPQTAIEAALAPKGQGLPSDRTIFALGLPSFADRLELNRRGESFYQAGAPVPPGEIARRAVAQAGDGTLVVVGPPVTLDQIRAFPGPLASFLEALSPRFHVVSSRTFGGPSVFAFGVFVFSGKPPTRA